MELEQSGAEGGNKGDGDIKNYQMNDGAYKEDIQAECIKQNGMSDHTGGNKARGQDENKGVEDGEEGSILHDKTLNSDNGEMIDDNIASDSENEDKDLEGKDSNTESSNSEQNDGIKTNSTDDENKRTNKVMNQSEADDSVEVSANESGDDTQNSSDRDEEGENSLCDRKVEENNAAKQLAIESEDSSKDSTDSSISNISRTSSVDMKLGENDKSNDNSDIPGDVKEKGENEKSENDKTDTTSEKIDKTEVNENRDELKTDNDKISTEGDNDGKENIENDKIDREKSLKDDGKPHSPETKETSSEKTAVNNENPNVDSSITGGQQPAVPLVVSVSNVPYTVPQSQPQITVHQQQTGYITKVGNQHIFVPMSTAAPHAGGAGIQPGTSLTNQVKTPKPGAAPVPTEKPPELPPKSSMDMMELMKWEIQNRVPDNYNWSVAFHPKKEELSSVTSFLLELGHDVVKEAVYKDIILIQTKKKEQGKLKDTEIESLEKMKTVYENTKKKVEHLDMKMKNCKPCKFKTESAVVMNHHKDHPHIEPYWDYNNGWLCCAHCDFRTKQTAAFSFHMEAVHDGIAKMHEKPGQFPCEMCPLDLSTNNKLTKHRMKCLKTFKLSVNLQPYYHDVNFCMKTCYYKPKRPVQKPPLKKIEPRPQNPRATVSLTTKTAAQMARQVNPQMAARQAQLLGIRQNMMHAQMRGPPPLQRHPFTPVIQAPQAARQPVVRQMIQQKQNVTPNSPARPQSKEMSGFEVCELCGGYVKDRQALRIHFYYAHKVEMPQTIFNRPAPPLSCDICQSKFWTTQGLSKHKSTLRHYTTSNVATRAAASSQKCFMCSRMVPNLFTHVEQSHGMTMRELVAMKKCIMCGITASDRKQLEVHMSTVHGVLIKASDFLGPDKNLLLNKSPVQQKAGSPAITSAAAAAAAAAAGGNKGKSMVRNNLCVFCQIQFADNIQLTMHCIKIHATCSACGMVVASSKHLQNHHCKKMMRDCVICGLKKLAPDAYAEHIKTHVKPCTVSVDKMSDKSVKTTKEDIKKNYKPAVISLDSDSGGESDVEVVDENQEEELEERKKPRKKYKGVKRSEPPKVELAEDGNDENDDEKKDLEEDGEETNHHDATENDLPDDDKKEDKDTESNIDEPENDNVGSDIENEDSNLSSKASIDDNEVVESDSASKTSSNQMEVRKRKNESSDEQDSEEPKRQKTNVDSDVSSPVNNKANDSDNDSRDSKSFQMQDSEASNAESQSNHGDDAVSLKRPHDEEACDEDDTGADSGTESDQANKRRKTVDDDHQWLLH